MANLTTLAAVKSLMGLKTPEADNKINALIPIVSALAQRYCERVFFTSVRTEWLDGGGPDLVLAEYPLSESVAPIVTEYVSPDDTGTVIASADYFVDNKNGILHMDGGCWLPGFRRYKVVYTAGLGADYDAINAAHPELTGAVAMWISQAFQAQPDAVATDEGANEYAIHLLSTRLPMGAVKDVLDLYRAGRVL